MSIDFLRREVGSKVISPELTIRQMISHNEDNIFLIVDYKNGKFVTDKSFTNDYDGKAEFKKTFEFFRKENNVREHFGLKPLKNTESK